MPGNLRAHVWRSGVDQAGDKPGPAKRWRFVPWIKILFAALSYREDLI
jgi:hypothetical protein